MTTPQYKLSDDGQVHTQADLIDWLDEFSQSDRYSSRRTQILRELEGRPFEATVLLVQASGTYGYTADPRLRRGQTIKGTIENTDHMVLVQMPAEQTAEIEAMAAGAAVPVSFVITRWHSVDKAYVGHSVFDLPASGGGTVAVETVDESPAATPAEIETPTGIVPEDEPASPADETFPAADEADEAAGNIVDLQALPVVEQPTEVVDLEAFRTVDVPPEVVDLDAAADAESAQEAVDLDAAPASDSKTSGKSISVDLDELASAVNPLTSHDLAGVISSLSGVAADTVEEVIESFWWYHFDPVRLVDAEFEVDIPLIGSFGLEKQGGHVVVTMHRVAEPTPEEFDNHIASADDISWIPEYEDSGDLPDDQRKFSANMAVHMADLHDLPLARAYSLVQQLLLVTSRVLTAGVRAIHWREFGAMKPSPDGYVMTTYKAMGKRLAALEFWFTAATEARSQEQRGTGDSVEPVAGRSREQRGTGDSVEPVEGRSRDEPFRRPAVRHRRQKQDQQVAATGCLKVVAIIIGGLWLLGQMRGCPLLRGDTSAHSPSSISRPAVVRPQVPLDNQDRKQLLAGISQYEDMQLRISAVEELARRHEDPEADVKVLLNILVDGRIKVRRTVAQAIGSYGYQARKAIPGLRIVRTGASQDAIARIEADILKHEQAAAGN